MAKMTDAELKKFMKSPKFKQQAKKALKENQRELNRRNKPKPYKPLKKKKPVKRKII